MNRAFQFSFHPVRRVSVFLFGALLATSLSAFAQPQITKQPVDARDVSVGATVTFSVTATTDSGPLKYQWRLNGENIPGANSNSYTIDRVQIADAGKYAVVVFNDRGATNSLIARLTVNIQSIVPPDDFANAHEIVSLLGGAIRTTNTNATREVNEPLHGGKPGGKSIWFKVHPTVPGILTINTAGSDFDTVVAVYSGSALDRLTPLSLDMDDDDNGGFLTAKLSFNLKLSLNPLEYYYIAVDGFSGDSGNIMFSWGFEATTDILPVITTRPDRRTVPYGSSLNMAVGYEGDASTLKWLFNYLLTPNGNNVITLNRVDESTVGNYSVRLESHGHYVETKPANIQINIQPDGSADTNSFTFDKFRDVSRVARAKSQNLMTPSRPTLQGFRPRPLGGGPSAGYTSTQIFSTINSSKELGEPNIAGEPGGASEWFSYQPTNSGTLHINTDGSSFDTVLGIYTGPGDSFETLTEVVSDNNGGTDGRDSRVRFTAVAGTIYYIAVDGVGGAKGTVRLNLNFGDPPSVLIPLQSLFVPQGSNALFSVSASGSTALSYAWRFRGTNIPGANASSYVVTNVDASKVGDYSVVVSNVIDTVISSAQLELTTAPVILVQPQGTTVASGSNVTLNVAASGSPTPSYQWRWNGADLSDGGDISGTTTSSLVINNFQNFRQGVYSVRVFNIAGSATSGDALLMVDAPLRLGSAGFDAGNNFQLQLIGSVGAAYELQASTNLVNWESLSTNSTSDGYILFTDPNASSYPNRFYRAKPNP